MKRLEDLKSRLVSIVFVVALVLGGLAQAATITVGSGTGYDFDAIQAGIDAANSGDTVLVAPGEYIITEPISFLGKAITVRSEAGPDETTIRMGTPADPERASVVVFENNETTDSVLDGFTITGGEGSWLVSRNDWGGGGILFNAASGTVRDCVIVQNTSKWGGGIYSLQPCSVSLIDCTIAENTAKLAFGGGVLSNLGSSMSLTNCIIRDNSATGVVYGTGLGGGACCWNSSMTMTHCTVIGNSAGNMGGGALSGETASLTMTHCTIVDNRTTGWCGGVAGWDKATVTMSNCTLWGNSGATSGAALGCYDQASATVTNSILWGNTAATGSEIHLYQDAADISVSYSNVAGGRAGVVVDGGKLNWGAGNIDMDPCFADPNNGDFHLKSQAGRWDPISQTWVRDEVTSPCIDRGDPDSDWSGELWPNGKYTNMGAYGGTGQASMSLSDAGHISDPVNLAGDVSISKDLHWRSDRPAVKYDLYFGTSFEDVNNAHTADPMGVLVSQAQDANTYDPGMLDFAQTYFWRVDQVNDTPDKTVFKGNVWSFEVEPYSIQIPGSTIAVTASSFSNELSMPEKVLDGSGLGEDGSHATAAETMWFTASPDLDPWIQFEFDAVKQLDIMKIWNANSAAEMALGWGVKAVDIAYSVDGENWDVLPDVTQFSRAPGAPTYNQCDEIVFGGVPAKYVRLNIVSNWGGLLTSYSLSEVQFTMIPARARTPKPAAGAITEGADIMLSWRAGRGAASHQVYFGTDPEDLGLLGTTTETTLAAGALEYGQTYYWSVLEVDEAGVPPLYAGEVWSFITPDYGVVDDFDQYDNRCNRIFFAWEDGLGHNGGEEVDNCDVPLSNGKGGGAVVGHVQAPFAEKTIVNVDSKQSLPLSYDNAMGQSETTLGLAGQDWTTSGVQTLSLFFCGQPDNSGQLYVKINHTKVVYDGDAADVTQAQWQQWNIDLTSLEGLQIVTTLTIGVDGENASGTLYIDDIRLYP